MTLDDIVKHYGTGYRFSKVTGYSHSTFYWWKKIGRIPVMAQITIQELTNGALIADMSELNKRKK